uniref:LOW QUALITY PROTEIN: death-inducer obliterator 1-like n=1 Tax=Oncorhynchus gorbuscha TaxID=8017 RepID=UPI001EAED14B|nr:LOW QUALITY PROTEIN: death-inducer obliterator 1-like [Oncorhynchus gorbuscha]
MPPLESDPETTEEKASQNDNVTEAKDEVEEEERIEEEKSEYSSISDSEGYNPHALYCICRQRHNKRFMISCDNCLEWFHGDCVGVSEIQGRKLERSGRDWICATCTNKSQSQPDPQQSSPDCLTLPYSGEEEIVHEEQASEEAVVQEVTEMVAEAEMELDGSLPQCIGSGCSKHALPDSVYCGTDCILRHAAATMKTLSNSKETKTKQRPQRRAVAKLGPKGQRSARMPQRLLAERPEEEGEEEEAEEVEDKEADTSTSTLSCDPSLTAVQATSIESPMFYKSTGKANEQVEVEIEPISPQTHSPDNSPSDIITESSPPLESAPGKTKRPANSCSVSRKPSVDTSPVKQPNPPKSSHSPTPEAPSTSASRHHETGALRIGKTSFTIPKKQPQPLVTPTLPSPPPPTPMNETRILPVSPAPIAPSSRPPQPANNQVRQSIQRSLTNIMFKRVCDCDDLERSETEVAKLVTSIETEMFNIFNNTDSKYMNKYRTIMFNLKDPKNKGLFYSVIRGEVSPFRLARMSQRDMQATKVSEPNKKDTPEVLESGPKATCVLPNPAPEPVKVDLPSLPFRPSRHMEQKSTLPATPKARPNQSSQNSSVPDILSCMLKDTTAEHRAHLFDLKCKICTGQITVEGEEEPVPKKSKLSGSSSSSTNPDEWKDRPSRPPWMYARTDPRTEERGWRTPAGDESPLLAPPRLPHHGFPCPPLMEDDSVLTIMESPASPTMESPASPPMESPASPILESPASPVMDSPTSPILETRKAKTPSRMYTPVMIPAVSTVSITRRDPRTAGNRSAVMSGDPHTAGNRTPAMATVAMSKVPPPQVSYVPAKQSVTLSKTFMPLPPPPSLPPMPALPKSILMKPSSSSFYGSSGSSSSSSRAVNSHSPQDGETTQFLAKQEVVWKGFLNMISVAKFVTKGYLVSGPSEYLKEDLPDTIQLGGRIMPQTVWDYIGRVKTSVTKELCVIRFHPATEEEEVAYVSLFSYFSSRRRFGVVANNSRSIKDIYLIPLSAKESIPSKLQPFEGSGFEKNRPNLLLGLVICQKPKRAGCLPQEVEEKRAKIHISKDSRDTVLPRPPTLYGSDPRTEEFLPYDPAMPIMSTPPGSPPSTGSPSESSSSGSLTIPSLLSSIRAALPASAPPPITSTSTTPLQTILKSLFGKDSHAVPAVAAVPLPTTLPPPPMVDPIVQQYGQKSKVKEIEEEENEYDRPYDPEEEYDPAMGYGRVAPINIDKMFEANAATQATCADDDDVAYDPEDETIFEDMHKDGIGVGKVPAPTSAPAPTPVPAPVQDPFPDPSPAPAPLSRPITGAVIVSAATLTEQQRMLEDLNRQIEEQKRQLKEQEEALRQQREAVGMFMAHFSVSDALMSPPTKSGLSHLQTQQSEGEQSEANPSVNQRALKGILKTEETEVPIKQEIKRETKTVPLSVSRNVEMPNASPKRVKEIKKESIQATDNSDPEAGEIQDSDVAYDPEDDTIFDELKDTNGEEKAKTSTRSDSARRSERSRDSSVSSSCRGASRNDTPDRRRKRSSQPDTHSPKRRDRKVRDRQESPPRRSGRRSPGHSDRRRERHRRGERSRPYHRGRHHSERPGRHIPHKERTSRRSSGSHRRSPSSPRQKQDSGSRGLSKGQRETSPPVWDDSKGPEAPEDMGPTSPTPALVMEANDSPQPPLERQDIDVPLGDRCDSGGPPHGEIEDTGHQMPHENPTPQKPADQQPSQSLLGSPSKGPNNEQGPNIQLQDNRDRPSQLELLEQCSVQSPSDIMREKQFSSQGPPHMASPNNQGERSSSLERRDPDMREGRRNQGPDMMGLGPNMRGERRGPQMRHPSPNIRGPDPDMRGERSGPQMMHQSPNIRGPEPDMRSPDMREDHFSPTTYFGGKRSPSPHFNSPRIPSSVPRGNLKDQRGAPCPGFRPRGPRTSRWMPPQSRFDGPHNPLVVRPLELLGKQRGTNQNHDSGGEPIQPEIKEQHIAQSPSDIMRENQFSSQGRPHMASPSNHGERSSSLERRDPDMREGRRHQGPDIRSPDMIEPGPDMRGPVPDMWDDRRGPGPDIKGPRPGMRGDRRGPDMWDARRGSGPDMRADRRGPDMWDDRRGPGPDMQVSGPEMGCPGPIMRGLGPDMQDPGPDMRGDRRGLEPDMRGDRRGPEPDMRGGPDIWDDGRGPGPDMTAPEMPDPDPDMRSPDMRMDHFTPTDNFGGERPTSTNFSSPRMISPVQRGHFEDQRGVHRPGFRPRGPRPSRFNQPRGSYPGHFPGGQPRFRFDGRQGVVRPAHASLVTPREHSIQSPSEILIETQIPSQGPPHMASPNNKGERSSSLERRDPDIGEERRNPGSDIRGPDMMGPGPDMRGDRRGPGPDMRGDRRGPGPDMRGDRRGPGPDMRDDRRGSEIRGPEMMGPGPDTRGDSRPGPDMRGDRRGPDMRDSGPNIRGPGLVPDTRGDRRGPGPDMRGERRGPGPDMRGDGRGPVPDMRGDGRGPGPDMRGDWRGPGPDMRGEGRGSGPDMRGDGRGPGLDMRGDGRDPGPDMRVDGSGPDMRGDGRGPGPDMRGDGIGLDMRGPGPDMGDPGPDTRGDRRGPGPDMRGPGPDMRDPGPNIRGPDTRGERRGPGLDMRGPGPDMRGDRGGPGPDMRVLGPDMRVLGPDVRGDRGGPGPDMRGDRRGQGSNMRGDRRGPDMRDPGPDTRAERRRPDMTDQGPDMRGPGLGRDTRGDRRWPGQDLRGPGPDIRGPGLGPDTRGDRRGPDIRGPRTDMRGDRRDPGPCIRDPGPDMRDPGPDMRDPGPDMRDPGPDMRDPGPDMQGPGPDMQGPGPDMQGLGPDMRDPGPDMQGPGPDMRDPGPDMRDPGPDMRTPEPDMRGPDTRGYRRGPGPDIWGDRRGPDMRIDRRGPGPGMRGPEPDIRGPGLGPDSRGDRRGPGLDMRGNRRGPGPDMRVPGPDTRGDRRGPGSEMRGPGPDMRDQEPDIREPGLGPDTRGDRRGTGPDMRGTWPETRGDRRGPGRDLRGLRPDMRRSGPDTRSDRRGPGPDMRGPGPDTIDQEPDIREPGLGPDTRGDRRGQGPDLRSLEPDMRGPGPGTRGDRRGPEPDIWGPGPDTRDQEPDIRGSDTRGDRRGTGPDMRDTGPDMGWPGLWPDTRSGRRGPNMRDPGPDKRVVRRGSGPEMEVPGPETRGDRRAPGTDMRGPRPDTREQEPNIRGQGLGPDTRGDRRGPDMRGDRRGPDMWDDRRGSSPNMRGPVPDMSGAGPDMWDESRGPDKRGDRRGPGPDMRGDRRWSGPDMSGAGSDMWDESTGPDMRGPGPDTRGDGRWPGPDSRGDGRWSGPDMRGPGPDIRGNRRGSDISLDRRGPGPDMLGERRGPNMRDPGPDTRGPGLDMGQEMRAPDPDMRSPDIRGDHFTTTNHFGGSRGVQSPGFHGPRGPRPSRFNQPRGSSRGYFPDNGGQPRFDGPRLVVRPLRPKGGLLPTPLEGLMSLPNNSPDAFREDQWRNSHSPDTRRTSLPIEDCEIRNYGDRENNSEERGRGVNPRDRVNFQGTAPCLSQGRQLPEDNGREQGGSHGRQGDRETGRLVSRERERVRGSEVDRPREEVDEKQKTPTEKDRDISRATSREGEANRGVSLHNRSLSKDHDRDILKDGSGKKEEQMEGKGKTLELTETPQVDTPQDSKGPV